MNKKDHYMDKILHKLRETGLKEYSCIICKGEEFTVSVDVIVVGQMFEKAASTGGPAALPTVPVVCDRCGNVQFFSLGVIGRSNKEIERNGK